MADNPLMSCRVKINRADKHLAEFQTLLDSFASRNPYSIFTDEESEPAIKIDKVRVIEDIPGEFGAIIGDTLHNLMSALDALALSLVSFGNKEAVTEEIMRDTYFPISWDGKLSSAKVLRFFERIGPDAEKIMRGLEPYPGGKMEHLFYLWRLDVIDKHRTIIPVGADLAGIHHTYPSDFKPNGLHLRMTPKPRFPLKDGDELDRRTFHEPEYYAHTHFTFQIAFGQGQIFEGEPVAPTLRYLLNSVEGVIDVFARSIFRTAW